jgi:hypothetical protein
MNVTDAGIEYHHRYREVWACFMGWRFLGERQSAPIPDREAHVDDRLRVVIMISDLKHGAVRDWVAHLVELSRCASGC